jgi:TPP-dependent pyruvate/acetoin dehydrogenase alpha subunit
LNTLTSEKEALEIYQKLTLIRQCQEVIIREYAKDEIKTPVHLGIGLEGISVGVAHCLPPNTKSFGQLRNHGQYLAVTGETDKFFSELYGKTTGVGGGKAGSMHLSAPEHGLVSNSGIVGSTIALAVGAAFAAKYRDSDDMSVAMFGDGAVEEGEFWESLNFASLHSLKVLFVCEDNDLAIYTFGAQRKGYNSISDPVRGFRCHVLEGDGTDVREVVSVCRTAVEMMDRAPGPAFINFKYHRFLDHVGAGTDYHVGYRPELTNEELEDLDPVHKYERYLNSMGMSLAVMEEIKSDVAAQIESSIQKAMSDPFPGEEDLTTGVFA